MKKTEIFKRRISRDIQAFKEWTLLIPDMSSPQRQGVAIGAETWRTFDTKKMRWHDWLKIREALEVGEKLCAEAAGKSEGGRYNRMYSKWLQDNGLHNVANTIRAWLREIRRHQSQIDAWRNSLPIEDRVRWNHPKIVLRNWRKSLEQDR
jgi:hypothetical protein